MISTLVQSAVGVALLLLFQWKSLKRGDKATLWLSCSLAVLAGGLYYYLQTDVHIPHPSVWIDQLLRPWSPIQERR